MWRFILVVFGFLGFAFYEMSGGADYTPASNSIQARASDKPSPTDADVEIDRATVAPVAAGGIRKIDVTRDSAPHYELMTAEAARERFEITLTSVTAADLPSATAKPADDSARSIEAAVEAAMQAQVAEEQTPQPVFSLETYAEASSQGFLVPRPTADDYDDIREVTGSVVNMRTGPGTEFDTVGKLTKGTQITVLVEPGNGWVMLEVLSTGETGWMAEQLVTASN